MKWILVTGIMASLVAGLGWCGHNKFIHEGPVVVVEEVQDVRLVKNRDNIRTLPSNFRLSTSAYIRHFGSTPSRKGLNKLHVSGSSQFSKRGLKAILRTIPSTKVLLIDLREESHGFLDGIAVSLYGYHNVGNIGKSADEIQKEEEDFLQQAQDNGFVLIYDDKNAKNPWPFHVERAFTEKELADYYNIPYIRLHVTDHHRPTDATVDEFVQILRDLPEDTWIHFHCAGGKGRTTTFMSMFDMTKNAKEVSAEEIIHRQWLLGGSDLATTNRSAPWKSEPALERKNFLKQFHQYAKENPNLEKTWTEWLRSKL